MIKLENYRAKMKNALEGLYEGVCTVYNQSKVIADDGSTSFAETAVLEDEPCRLSHSSFPTNSRGEQVASRTSTITLYLAPDKVVPSGSRIAVTQYGETVTYWMSGQPKIFSTHQEIELALQGGYA